MYLTLPFVHYPKWLTPAYNIIISPSLVAHLKIIIRKKKGGGEGKDGMNCNNRLDGAGVREGKAVVE